MIFSSFKSTITHRMMYYLILCWLAISLPLSPWGVTAFQMALLLNWLIEGGFRHKFSLLIQQKGLLLFLSIFAIHLIGVIYTSDFKGAMHDLKIKLPLLVIPFVIGTSEKISIDKVKTIIRWFAISLVFVSVQSTLLYYGNEWVSKIFLHENVPVNDIRDIIISFSHIRFALLLNIAIFSLLYFHFFDKTESPKVKVIWVAVTLWLVFFLFFLKALTGILVFGIVLSAILIYEIFKIKNLILKWFFVVGGIFAILLTATYLSHFVGRFYKTKKVDYKTIETHTENGNKYRNDFNNKQIENGNYIWIYFCDKELRKEWNMRSELDFLGNDKKGNRIRETLIRYLSSKGLRKDSAAIASLTDEDIQNVESGIANHLYTNPYSLKTRLYMIIWQVDTYLKGGNPSGGSITQRVEYLKGGAYIVSKNCWFGVGTGGQKKAFRKYYAQGFSKLNKRNQRRTHNQFLTIWLTLGILGLIWFLHAMIYPIIIEKQQKNFLALMILVIAFLSMINEDTLETQIGVTYIAFYYSLFVFGISQKPQSKG